MTLTEKILARAAGRDAVKPGDFLEIEPDHAPTLQLRGILAQMHGRLEAAVRDLQRYRGA